MQLFANNAESKLAASISNSATSITLQNGDGAKFPSVAGGDFFLVTLLQRVGATEANWEVVKCTARTGDVLTVVRAQEGTLAIAHAEGEIVSLRLTAGTASNFETQSNKDASGGYAGLTAFKINFMNALGTFKSFFTNANTAVRTYLFPDKDGTVAMLSDITGTNSGTNTGDETKASIEAKLGFTPANKAAPTITDSITLVGTAPIFALSESDQTGAEGLFRWVVQGNTFYLQKNTASTRDYATAVQVITVNTFGELLIQTPAVGTNNAIAASTAYVVARIAQDAASKGANTFTGDQNLNNKNLVAAKTVAFNGEYDAGNSGSAITIDWNNGQNQKVTLTAACNITFTNMGTGHYQLRLVQDATGSRTVNFVSLSGTRWLGATSAPALNTTANSETFLNIYYGGGVYTQTLSKVGAA